MNEIIKKWILDMLYKLYEVRCRCIVKKHIDWGL